MEQVDLIRHPNFDSSEHISDRAVQTEHLQWSQIKTGAGLRQPPGAYEEENV